MKKTIILSIAIIQITSGGQSQVLQSGQVDSLIDAGIRQTMLCDFDGAMATFQRLADGDPDNPAGPFYLAATLQSKMMDEETADRAAEFYRQIDRVIRMTEGPIKAGTRDPLVYEYLGSAYSYRGLFEAKQGRLVKGVLHAHKGVGYLQEALKLDSTLMDACAGVGNYMYWSGHFYRYLRWLPFISDEREAGIRLIRKTVERGRRSRWVGITSLGWIEYDRKNFKAGFDLFESGLRQFPGSRFFLWGAADCAFGMKDFTLAIRLYSELLSSIRGSGGRNGYNEAECHFNLLKAYKSLGEYDKAVLQAKAIVAIPPSNPAIESRIKKHRKAARDCLERFEGGKENAARRAGNVPKE
jgi:tetratricopeptide (TPR) repeat protein